MVVDCPHCFTKVIPNPDGTCPACQGNARSKGARWNRLPSHVAARGLACRLLVAGRSPEAYMRGRVWPRTKAEAIEPSGGAEWAIPLRE